MKKVLKNYSQNFKVSVGDHFGEFNIGINDDSSLYVELVDGSVGDSDLTTVLGGLCVDDLEDMRDMLNAVIKQVKA